MSASASLTPLGGVSKAEDALQLLRDRFISGMSHASASVNVVTTDGPCGRAGVTVSAMSSVSADSERPTLLVCVHHLSPACAAILDNRVFCVNVLRDDQSYISDAFAGRSKLTGDNKFLSATWAVGKTGSPRVVDPLVAFDCELAQNFRVGSHLVFVGEVVSVFIAEGHAPLIYTNRAYGTPTRLDWQVGGQRYVKSPDVLRIGCFYSFAPYVLPSIVAKLLKTDPGIEIALLQGHQGQVLEALRSESCEVALTYNMELGTGLHLEHLAEIYPKVLLSEQHELAKRDSIALAELVGMPLILLQAPPSEQYFLNLFRSKGLDPRIRIRSTSFETVRGLVGHGLGYSVLATNPKSDTTYDGHRVVSVPFKDKVVPSRVVTARKAGAPMSRLAETFMQACRSHFA